jgi:murein DD-endopeptidase MepM/ murein hydrolase activator NlpD
MSCKAILLVAVVSLSGCGGGDGGIETGGFTYDCSVFPTASQSPFTLPWPVGETHKAYPHAANFAPSPQMYAIDLEMPIDTHILAIRDGTVVRVVEDFLNSDHQFGHENAVYVEHADGTVARYLHLTTNGARVELGDSVVQGEWIASSGNSGNSKGPHLHLDVTASCCAIAPDYDHLPEGQTRPLNFKNVGRAGSTVAADVSCGLMNKLSYSALAD